MLRGELGGRQFSQTRTHGVRPAILGDVIFFSFFFSSHLLPMDVIITILLVVTKDFPISPRFTPYELLSQCKFSALSTRQQIMVIFLILTFSNPALARIELTTSALAGVQVTY